MGGRVLRQAVFRWTKKGGRKVERKGNFLCIIFYTVLWRRYGRPLDLFHLETLGFGSGGRGWAKQVGNAVGYVFAVEASSILSSFLSPLYG